MPENQRIGAVGLCPLTAIDPTGSKLSQSSLNDTGWRYHTCFQRRLTLTNFVKYLFKVIEDHFLKSLKAVVSHTDFGYKGRKNRKSKATN